MSTVIIGSTLAIKRLNKTFVNFCLIYEEIVISQSLVENQVGSEIKCFELLEVDKVWFNLLEEDCILNVDTRYGNIATIII